MIIFSPDSVIISLPMLFLSNSLVALRSVVAAYISSCLVLEEPPPPPINANGKDPSPAVAAVFNTS